jgi:hypothetical protein
MKHLTDSTLSALDHASAKLKLFSSLLDKFVERVVPPVTASACSGSKCAYTTCTDVRCGHHMVGYYLYSNRPRGCESGIITCRVQACFC